MSTPILYEHPLNERIRSFLRLEHFFGQSHHFRMGSTSIETQATITALIEILTMLERTDVRSEALKELERQIAVLTRLIDTPEVDRKRLENTLDRVSGQIQTLQQSTNKMGPLIRENELLTLIRQRHIISAGTCSFDLPAYHYWLNQPRTVRQERLLTWLSELKPLKESLDLILSMIRNSGSFEPHIAEGGFFQKSLDPQNPCQLLQLKVKPAEAYPEISGNKHRVNIRFLRFSEQARPKQIGDDLPFEISFCGF